MDRHQQEVDRHKFETLITKNLPPEFTAEEATTLISAYYRAPLKVLETQTRKGVLIRLKRGLYVLASLYDPLLCAGVIGQPSYISFETALSFYGMIPERAYNIISVIDGRSFNHNVKNIRYIYRKQDRELFAKGMTTVQLKGRHVLFALPEKALLDALSYKKFDSKKLTLNSIYEFVLEDFRIEESSLKSMSLSKLTLLANFYHNLAPKIFTEALKLALKPA